MMRRGMAARRHSRGQGTSAVPAAPTYASILGSLAVEIWDSRYGIGLSGSAVVGWTGQVRGIVLVPTAAANRPTYVVDGTKFGGKPVVQTFSTGSKGVHNYAIAPAVVVAGTRPWIFSRARFTDTNAGDYGLMCVGASGNEYQAIANRGGFGGVNASFYNASAPRVLVSTISASVRSYECWADGTLLNGLVDGGAPITTAAAQTLPADCPSVGIGQTAEGPYWFANAIHALHIIASAYPGAAAVAAIRALAIADFPP